ncbi:blue (type 1) copper domain-containing protein [Natrialba chahannaoensis JCM 10990]|uniref:Blue (Type 1) copper domain-containing protein n=1 Tax=Natrialba chahannaoensis JCM 10990 TaxID=1227492 RepID=M0AKX9_9EURY|nr:PQQ-dependent sugar dehydrogenase [Natrialba chahannaoensis]ELY98577.1 blue (type 1) copper domain-containing protein [Natrialba chahannaoensis JCM 10990]
MQATALASVSGFATTALAQDGEDSQIELLGRTSGWIGSSPDDIAEERNPTLELVEGEEYTLIWENEDGAGHNFVIEDEEGEENFVETELISGTGETQEVEFTAEEGMAEYYCSPHPQSMRGDIELVDEANDEEEDVEDEPDVIIGDGPTVGLETVADGLNAPIDLQFAEEETDRRFIVDQTGQIYVHGEDGLGEEPFLDIEDRMVELDDGFDERGLLGLAFHPDFEENGRFYVRYSAPGEEPEYGAPGAEVPEVVDHLDTLAQFEATDDNTEADPDSEEILLEIPQPQFNHNAGPIEFGPDDCLYVSTGDGGGAGDDDEGHVDDWYPEIAGGNGQDTEHNLLGGILRIDVDDDGDEERNYGIPDDNPLVDSEENLPEYWAWGLRNPWGMSFENGELLAADVGQALFEIINHVEEGGNYGWNVWEGTHCFDPDTPEEPPEDCPDNVADDLPEPRGGEPLLGPVIEYPQEVDMGRYGDEVNGDDENGEEEDVERGAETDNGDRDRIGTAIIGGAMYEAGEIGELENTYVFGDWSWDGEGPGRLFIAHPPEGWPNGEDGIDDEDDAELDDEDDTDEVENGTDDENGEDFEPVDPEGEDADDENGVDENGIDEDGLEQYHPPDEVDLWDIEELTVEGDGEVAGDGMMEQLVYAFSRDADGEVYVLTSDTPTIEGEGFVSRLVPADDEDVDDEEVVDDEDDLDEDDEEIDDEEDDVAVDDDIEDDEDEPNGDNAANGDEDEDN